MKFSSYLGREKMSDLDFINTFISKLENLSSTDIAWALHYNEDSDENEDVQSLLMDMVFSFYATDLVQLQEYEQYLNNKDIKDQCCNELRASLIDLFHRDRVVAGSLIVHGVGESELLRLLYALRECLK